MFFGVSFVMMLSLCWVCYLLVGSVGVMGQLYGWMDSALLCCNVIIGILIDNLITNCSWI